MSHILTQKRLEKVARCPGCGRFTVWIQSNPPGLTAYRCRNERCERFARTYLGGMDGRKIVRVQP